MQLETGWDHVPAEKLDLLAELHMHAVLSGGCSGNDTVDEEEGAFIGRVLWADMLSRANEVRFKRWSPSTKKHRCERHAKRIFAPQNGMVVTHNFPQLVTNQVNELDEHGLVGRDRTMACIAVGTGDHATVATDAFNAGARFVYLDKPSFSNIAQWKSVRATMNRDESRRLFLLQNHRCNNAVQGLRDVTHEWIDAGDDVEGDGSFEQPWLSADTESKQAKVRIAEPRCSAFDLGWHVFDMAEHVGGAVGQSVDHCGVMKDLAEPNQHVITGGSSKVAFDKPNYTATVSFNQAKPKARMDDISYKVTNKTKGITWLWAMASCGGDVLLKSTRPNPDRNKREHWTEVEFGQGDFPNIQEIFTRQPYGHMPSCWINMGYYALLGVIGEIARIRGIKLASEGLLPKHMCQPVPGMNDIGKRGIQWVFALERSASENCAVNLSDID